MNINYGHLNIMIFRTLPKMLLKWHDKEEQQPSWQRGRMHKHLSEKQRHWREKNIETDLKIAVNFRVHYEGR